MYRFLVFLSLCPPALAFAATIPVAPGQSVQQALDRAQAGDVVQLAAGTYHERLTIPRNGITLRGVPGQTILDGSTPASGWTPAPEMGPGVWKASLGSPQALTAQGPAVQRISDKSMGDGSGKVALSRPAAATVNTATGTVPAWNGIEALFGNRGGTTYLRVRNGQNPADIQVRSAPAGAVVTLQGRSQTTLTGLTIQGGEFSVEVQGGRGNVIEHSTLKHGKNRVLIWGDASGTIVRKNRLLPDHLGLVRHTPGDRDTSPPARMLNRWLYDVSKFVIGDTETNDASILLAGTASGTQILDNDIGTGLMGMVFYGTTRGTLVQGNEFHHFADIGIYVNADGVQATITGNRFQDAEHALRLESMHRTTELDIVENCFVGVTPGAKHVFVAPPRGGSSPAKVEVTRNTFRGGGWAVDLGGTGEFSYTIPGLRVTDNLIAVNGISSGGTKPIGHLAGNRMQAAGSAVSQCEVRSGNDVVETPPAPAPTRLRILLQ